MTTLHNTNYLSYFIHFAPVALLAFSTACDRDELAGPKNSVNGADDGPKISRERQDQALMSTVVADDPDRWAAGSCAGACGGPSPDKSCWCTSDCVKYNDCCHDYELECLGGGGSGGGPGSGAGNKPKENKPQIKILDVQVSGSGCARDPRTGRLNHEVFISSFNEGHGYKDNAFRVYFQNGVFDIGHPVGTASKNCTVNALVKWTPGHRITVHQVEMEGEAELYGTLEGNADFRVRPNAGQGPGDTFHKNFSTPFEAGFGSGASLSPDTWSNCSGLGYIRYDLNATVEAQSGSANAKLERFHSAIQFPDPGTVPEC